MAGDRERLTRYSAVQETPEEFSSYDRRKAASNRWSFGRINSFFWMLVSFLCGTGISIGHHFFYSRFNGLRVDEVSISQTWIIRIGTIFAFVAKTLLVMAVSIAFVQQQWLALSSNRFKIRQIDAMTSVLSNALNFLQSRIWLHFPLLTVLAIVVWLLPIAAIITPATINVITKSDNRLELQENVPQLYFDPNRYANLQTLVRSDYVGHSPAALRTAFGSAMTGRMLGIPQTSPNMTYNLEFLGPALRCDHADANLTGDVLTSYKNYLSGVENRYRYISWVPSGYGRGNLTSATGEDIKYLDTDSTDAAHIYVIPNTTDAGPIVIGGMTTGSSDDHYGYQDLLDCKLYNASYRTSFNLTFPTQAIAIESTEFLNPVNASTDIADWRYAKGSPDVLARHAQRICYQSIMDSFGRLLVGYEWWRDGFVVTEKTSWNMMAIDWTTRDGTQKGLEALFQNITLSMLGTSPLTMNSTVAARNAVPVNILTSVNVYSYKPEDLWLAYGIACVAALLSTILGAYGIWRNGGSGYQNIFSTYVRATRNQELKDVIDSNDDAAEPLPKKLSETSIMLDTRKQSTKNISMHTWR